ncbi:MAG: hypothetical protein HY711_05375, partial [Candidatus Melainabacteria bacterium]|nr:hypothetical protein [Candidatus Melainabacteria bacterium]
VMGMPIHPEFLRPPTVSRADFLEPLGLNPDVLTVCLNAGVAGGGNMVKIYHALSQSRRPVQVIFLCGQNQHLFHQVRHELKAPPVPTAVLPFHDSMWNLMSACDLMVTKAGGLTTFEAVARRLPMAIDLVSEAMPQEVGTAELLIAQDLAKPVRSPHDIVHIVESLECQSNKPPLPAVHNLDHIDAVYDIARVIIASCNPAFDPTLIPETCAGGGGHGWANGAYVPWSH